MNELSDVDAAYIAGLIDGEGTIRVKKDSRRELYYPIVIVVTNSNKDLVDIIHLTIGCGTVRPQLWERPHNVWWSKNPIKQKKVIWRLGIFNKSDIYELLRQVYPYIILKRELAELVMELIEIRNSLKTRRGKLKGQRSDREREIYLRVKELNSKRFGGDEVDI